MMWEVMVSIVTYESGHPYGSPWQVVARFRTRAQAADYVSAGLLGDVADDWAYGIRRAAK